MNNINKKEYKKDLINAIKDSEELEQKLVSQSKSHQFLNTARGENKILLVNLLAYLLDKNLIYTGSTFSEDFFKQQLLLTHRASLQSIHIAMEQCFKQIITDKNFGNVEPKINKKYNEIINALHDESLIRKLEELKQKHLFFIDYLEKIMEKIYNKAIQKKTRAFFTGLNIVRNKLSHSPELTGEYLLTVTEIKILQTGGLGKLVNDRNCLQFSVQFYSPIFSDLNKFLDLFYD